MSDGETRALTAFALAALVVVTILCAAQAWRLAVRCDQEAKEDREIALAEASGGAGDEVRVPPAREF